MSVLCMALFVLTESVLVFLAMMVMFFVMFAMSILHADKMSMRAGERMFAITMCIFGVITVMPAVTGVGILYLMTLPHDKAAWRELSVLL